MEEFRRLKAVDELLETLTGVLAIRDVFDRVSGISHAVLPRDALLLGRLTPDRQSIRVWAHSAVPDGFVVPEVVPLPDPTVVQREWEFMLLDDITANESVRRLNHPLLKYGFRSVLRVPLREDGAIFAALNLVSFRPGAYSERDVLVAKRVAGFVHLALSHHRLCEEAEREEGRVEGVVAPGRPPRPPLVQPRPEDGDVHHPRPHRDHPDLHAHPVHGHGDREGARARHPRAAPGDPRDAARDNLGKLFPFVLIGVFQLTLITVLMRYLFEVPIAGSVVQLYLAGLLFMAAVLGLGMLLSIVAKTQMQAMQLSFLFLLPFVFLSRTGGRRGKGVSSTFYTIRNFV